MAEYLSPGVYMEEFESGMQPMEGVGTSTAGFVGMAEKGPVKLHKDTNRPVAPVLVTSVADYRRVFGGYLPEKLDDKRFLPHAVEQFFANGGSRCYVMRVAPKGAVIATSLPVGGSTNTSATTAIAAFSTNDPVAIVFRAKTAGVAGNTITVSAKGVVTATVNMTNFDKAGHTFTLDNVTGLEEGDIVKVSPYDNKGVVVYNRIKAISDKEKSVTFVNEITLNSSVQCCRLDVTISQGGNQVKTVNKVSLNNGKPSYIATSIKDVVELKVDNTLLGQVLDRDASKGLIGYFGEATGNNITGSDEVVVKLANGADKKDAGTMTPLLQFKAKNEGEWGNKIRVTAKQTDGARTTIKEGTFVAGTTQTLKSAEGFEVGDVVKADGYNCITAINGKLVTFENSIDNDTPIQCCRLAIDVVSSSDEQVERYEDVSFNVGYSTYIKNVLAKSNLVDVLNVGDDQKTEPALLDGVLNGTGDNLLLSAFMTSFGRDNNHIPLDGGADGDLAYATADMYKGVDVDPRNRTGLKAFTGLSNVSIMSIPGITDEDVQKALVTHCEIEKSCFAILDMPCNTDDVKGLQTTRGLFDTNYAAMYHPWIQVFDASNKKQTLLPPSGFVAGIYARSDNTRGVHKAPANEVVQNALGLSCYYGKGEQDELNPKGINIIRALPGQGIRVWGARTCSSNPLWKYVNVRRLFIFLEESIKSSINWAVFEPNDEVLWTRVRLTISSFLRDQHRAGALVGATEEQAFYVKIGPETMSPQDRLNGRLICEIGVAPSRPAEFVIFRITQMTGSE